MVKNQTTASNTPFSFPHHHRDEDRYKNSLCRFEKLLEMTQNYSYSSEFYDAKNAIGFPRFENPAHMNLFHLSYYMKFTVFYITYILSWIEDIILVLIVIRFAFFWVNLFYLIRRASFRFKFNEICVIHTGIVFRILLAYLFIEYVIGADSMLDRAILFTQVCYHIFTLNLSPEE